MIGRLVLVARFWWWRAQGTGGHLPSCRFVDIEMVGRAGGVSKRWTCAEGCPVEARRRADARKYLERWAGHRGG